MDSTGSLPQDTAQRGLIIIPAPKIETLSGFATFEQTHLPPIFSITRTRDYFLEVVKKPTKSGLVEYFQSEMQRIEAIGTLSPTLTDMAEIIQKSSKILELHDNFDDEGSLGYNQQTWDRAVGILMGIWRASVSTGRSMSYHPKLFPGPEGSIDILWKGGLLELLLNVKRGFNDRITYYGHRRDGVEIEGAVNPDDFSKIINFLHCE